MKFIIDEEGTLIDIEDVDKKEIKTLEIPEGVVQIADGVFENCLMLSEVKIPTTLKIIGEKAFHNCISLERIEIPDSVEVIGPSAFKGCTSLKKIRLPKLLKSINDSTFAYCTSLKTIEIPEGVEIIGKDAFFENSKLTKVKLPTTLKVIKTCAFYNCINLESIDIPEGVETIENSAFFCCSYLQELKLPKSLKRLEDSAFDSCRKLLVMEIPEGLEYMGKGVFEDCKKLRKITLPKIFEKVESNCFSEFVYLESIEIPEGVEIIGDNAFNYCRALQEVKLPKSLKKIECQAFSHCVALKKIEIPQGVEIIDKSAFRNCSSLVEIKLPTTLKIISADTFYCCTSLESIEIPEGVEVISQNAFYRCANLQEIKFPKTLKKIKYAAFTSCSALKSIEIPEEIEEIEEDAFYGCQSLEKIKLPSTLNSISKGTFRECTSLEKIEIPEGVESIYDGAFIGCRNLKEVKLPSTLKTIEYAAFNNCTSLEKIEIPEGVETIGWRVFDGCLNLKEISFPSTVKVIGGGILSRCENLEKIAFKNMDFFKKSSIEENLEKFQHFYINRETNELICSKNSIDNLKGYEKIDINIINELKTKYSYKTREALLVMISVEKENFEKLEHNTRILLPKIIKAYDIKTFQHEYNEIFKNDDQFNNLLKQIRKITKAQIENHKIVYENIFNLAYTLGAFSDNEKQRQTACEFIAMAFQSGYFDMHSIHGMFESLKPKKYSDEINKEWSEFIRDKNNFRQLIELERENNGYITSIYNSFESIREFGRKSRGSQDYRNVTIDMCKKYFSKIYFNGVKERDLDIVEEFLKFNDLKNQEAYDEAVEIRDEYLALKKEGKIEDHLLGEELKEKDVFEQIEEERKNCVNKVKDTIEILDEIASKKFTYEFLSRYDAKNFVLGKYCSCCAHIRGAGYGIMKASILHPNCQNLVIRDSKGNIIAKSTLYVNREQGYGVFNNIEVNNNITDEKTLELIYKKYMKAINDFATRYNEINPDKPITQINVGMGLNDLESQLIRNNKKSNRILAGILFSFYGKKNMSYNGDWQDEQYVVWSKDDKREVKSNGR